MIRQDHTSQHSARSVFLSKRMVLALDIKSNETIPPKPLIFWQFHEKDEILTYEIDCFNLWMIV
jgi:hypothetical protein